MPANGEYIHASNVKARTDAAIFRHDNNNVAAIELALAQKRLLAETARLHEEKLKEATQGTEVVQKELDGLAQILENERKENRETLAERDKKLEDLKITDKAELDAFKAGKEKEMEQLRTTAKAELDACKAEKEKGLKQLEETQKFKPYSRLENCLPFQYHNSTVMIVNLQSRLPLDVGKQCSTRGWAWHFGWDNGSQVFNLAKVSGINDADTAWTITQKNTDRKLYCPYNGNADLEVGSPGSEERGRWLIGHGSSGRAGSWVLKNVGCNSFLRFEKDGAYMTKAEMCESFDVNNNNMTADWLIIPQSFV